MAKRLIVVGVIQGYYVDDTQEDINDLIRRDVAESISADPSSFIIFDAPPELLERIVRGDDIGPIDIAHATSDHTVCPECIARQIQDVVDMMPEE